MSFCTESRWITAVSLPLALTGCGAGWHRVETEPGPVRARQQVQVWHGDRFEQWHAVVVAGDSVSGIRYHQAIGCDTCRVAIPLSAVDSLRFGNPTAGFWKTVGLVFGLQAVFLAVTCPGGGCME